MAPCRAALPHRGADHLDDVGAAASCSKMHDVTAPKTAFGDLDGRSRSTSLPAALNIGQHPADLRARSDAELILTRGRFEDPTKDRRDETEAAFVVPWAAQRAWPTTEGLTLAPVTS